jgi:hypothetical protein
MSVSQTKSRDWLVIVGNFGVVVGLILVAFQINQSSYLVRAEIGSNSYNRLVENDRMTLDPGFAEVWAKSLEQPESLTTSEMIQLDGYLHALIDSLEGDEWLYDIGIYEGSNDDYLTYTCRLIGGNRFALSWWTEMKSEYRDFQPVLVEKIDKLLANAPFEEDLERLKRIQSRL